MSLDPNGWRCVPDVTSYAMFFPKYAEVQSVKGTSVAAPLWAALIALANEYRERRNLPSVGNFNELLKL